MIRRTYKILHGIREFIQREANFIEISDEYLCLSCYATFDYEDLLDAGGGVCIYCASSLIIPNPNQNQKYIVSGRVGGFKIK